MEGRTAKQLLHVDGWLARAEEIVTRGKDAYMDDAMLQEAGDSLMMKIGEAAGRLDRMGTAPPDGVRWNDAIANRNFLIHQYDAIDREISWATLSADLAGWRRALAALVAEADDATARNDPKTLPAAVLWDMDGTLVDTEPYWINAEHELVGEFGGVWNDELAHLLVGNPLLVSAQVIRDNSPVTLIPEQIVDRLLESVIRQMREHIPWRPGAAALLKEAVAQGIPNALVTMSYASFAQVMVDELPAGTFSAIVTGDAVTHGKPHPEPYLKAAEALGVDPIDCLAVEDSPTGARSAVDSGARTVAVPHIVAVPDEVGAAKVDTLAGQSLESLWRIAQT
ncbi:HAD-IA family hydrolase [Calidifontibacter indicus]|uniref:HAD-IA family hydrolase n=1 Tax=Calidifontibacter indicus TaxID=419650 RepID=UPI003D757516